MYVSVVQYIVPWHLFLKYYFIFFMCQELLVSFDMASKDT